MTKDYSLNFKAIDNAHALWRSKMRGQATPFRSDLSNLDPNAHMLIERTEKGRVVLREVGHFIENLAGGMVAGRTLDALFVDFHRARVREAVDEFFKLTQRAEIKFGIDAARFKFVLFPIRADHGPNDYAFVATNLVATTRVAPNKLAFYSVDYIPLHHQYTQGKYGFAEEKGQFDTGTAPKLRVIAGEGQRGELPVNSLSLVHSIKREP